MLNYNKFMKKKYYFLFAFICFSIISVISLGLNIYFLSAKLISASSIFNLCKASVLEIKAETENVGISYGTAELISTDGTMITNAHIVTYTQLGARHTFDNIAVRFVDEENFRDVELIKFDADLDIAVLKLVEIDRKITPIKIGDDNKLNAGDNIYAIGNLSNYGLSITSGIISIPHINVTYNDYTRTVIQCDLTISDGNSGGALVNSKGELVGLTTFRLKDQSNNIIYGISYCIPINTVLEYIESN